MRQVITIIGFLALLMAACSGVEPQAGQTESQPSNTGAETAPEVADTSAEAPEPETTPTPKIVLSPDELSSKWEAPLAGAMMVSMGCEAGYLMKSLAMTTQLVNFS